MWYKFRKFYQIAGAGCFGSRDKINASKAPAKVKEEKLFHAA
jgi:hypothetical protein